MKLLLIPLFVLIIEKGRSDSITPRCQDGTNAILKDNWYCCIDDGFEYCSYKDDPFRCRRPKLITKDPSTKTEGRAKEEKDDDKGADRGKHKKIEKDQTKPKEKIGLSINKGKSHDGLLNFLGKSRADNSYIGPEYPSLYNGGLNMAKCSKFPVRRSALATLYSTNDMSNLYGFPKIYTLSISQLESCDVAPEVTSIRLTGGEIGKMYSIVVGSTIDCGGEIDPDVKELAQIQISSFGAVVQVPSIVAHLRELQGKHVSLTSVFDEGDVKTFGCGTLRVF